MDYMYKQGKRLLSVRMRPTPIYLPGLRLRALLEPSRLLSASASLFFMGSRMDGAVRNKKHLILCHQPEPRLQAGFSRRPALKPFHFWGTTENHGFTQGASA